ncbi:RAMP superfamily CRISPR-associated protein [Vibrio sp. DNB22_12_1]
MSVIHVVKLVVETVSPMAISSGQRETNFDTALARDANGLPTIPATAIAGVWSHLTEQFYGKACQRFWFGEAANNKEQTQDKDGTVLRVSSRFSISNGVLHDQDNRPAIGFIDPKTIEQDEVLKRSILARPHHRERVSINDRGVAIDQHKFDQIVLPTGARFSITIRWEAADARNPHEVLLLWNLRQMAFGSSTRNGLGQINLVASQERVFDLALGEKSGEALSQYINAQHVPEQNELRHQVDIPNALLAELPLQALDNWRCGTGTDLLTKNYSSEQKVAILTYSEPRWQWSDNRASWQKSVPVLCGSSVKGMLAHRVAFHYRKRNKQWAEDMAQASHEEWQTRPEGIEVLFGRADEANHLNSFAGMLIVDDCELSFDPEHLVIRHHNAIDRFTGGVRKGALYSEELLYQPKFTLRIWLNPLAQQQKALQSDPNVFLALKDTIKDIEMGLLPMGAGSGRGNSLVIRDNEKQWQVNLSSWCAENKEVGA